MKSYSSIWIHLIWTTENRVPILHKSFRVPLFKFVKQNSLQKDCIVDTVNGVEDHMHCLVRMLPSQKLSDIVKQIKGSSSRWVNKKQILENPFRWQKGYGAISVNPSDINNIRHYIIKQEQHHQHQKLEEEIKKFQFYTDL